MDIDVRPYLAMIEKDSVAVLSHFEDHAEATDVAKDNPEIVARLTKLALDWKATLPKKPNPGCLSKQDTEVKPEAKEPVSKASGVSPEVRERAFTRWDANNDNILTLDEYNAGLKGQDNLDSHFKNFDNNSDGKLTHEEFVRPSNDEITTARE